MVRHGTQKKRRSGKSTVSRKAKKHRDIQVFSAITDSSAIFYGFTTDISKDATNL